MKPGIWTVAGLALLWAAPAGAEWVQKYSGGADDGAIGTSIHSPDGQHVFACGANFNVQNPFTDPIHKIVVSQDGGEIWNDITADAEGIEGFMLLPSVIHFASPQVGFLGAGDKLFRTADGGAVWTQTVMSAEVHALHFFDADTGLAVGSGGSIWRTTNGGQDWTAVSSPAAVTLKAIDFIDDDRGWVVGNDSHTEGEAPNEVEVAEGGQVLYTADGGQSWELLWETDGEFLGCVFFTDAQAGWLCAGDNDEQVYLRRSQDGGASFSRQDVPLTVNGVMGSTKSLVGLRIDGDRGQMLGFFDTGMSSSNGGNVYMIADYSSDDGGQSWQLAVNDPGGFQNPQPEGGMAAAHFYSDRLAWATGTGLRIVKNAPPCFDDDDCYPGYICVEGVCERNEDGPCVSDEDCFADFVCRDGVCSEPAPGPCETDADCPPNKVCQHGHCVDPPGCYEDRPVGQQGCPYGQICIFGTCIQDRECETEADCSDSQRCFEGRCYPDDLPEFRCLEDADCAAGEHCVDTWCEPDQEPDGGVEPDGGGEADGGGGDGGAEPDGGAAGDDDAPADGGSSDDGGGGGGCGRPIGAHGPAWLLLALLLLGAAWRRRP
jgi:photosystem II stability/assembly factor-like uncharacterized protein